MKQQLQERKLRAAKDLLYHANLYCRFGLLPDNTERTPDQGDKDAAEILMDKFTELVGKLEP